MGKLYNADFGEVASTLSVLTEVGFTDEDFAVLRRPGGREVAKQLLTVIRGQAKVEMIKHLVDRTADPLILEGWIVVHHDTSLGQLELDTSKIELYLSKRQQGGGKWLEGNKLRKELEGKKVLNANVLDDWLADSSHIPENVRVACQEQGKVVSFWGTIYQSPDGFLFVRCLRWIGDRWDWDFDWLDSDWRSGHPAAVLAS